MQDPFFRFAWNPQNHSRTITTKWARLTNSEQRDVVHLWVAASRAMWFRSQMYPLMELRFVLIHFFQQVFLMHSRGRQLMIGNMLVFLTMFLCLMRCKTIWNGLTFIEIIVRQNVQTNFHYPSMSMGIRFIQFAFTCAQCLLERLGGRPGKIVGGHRNSLQSCFICVKANCAYFHLVRNGRSTISVFQKMKKPWPRVVLQAITQQTMKPYGLLFDRFFHFYPVYSELNWTKKTWRRRDDADYINHQHCIVAAMTFYRKLMRTMQKSIRQMMMMSPSC